jgi:hypothetical protein
MTRINRRIPRLRAFALALAALVVSWDARAQTNVTFDFAPPHVDLTDPVGVELNSGVPGFQIAPVGIGPTGRRLTFWQHFTDGSVGYSGMSGNTGVFGNIVGSPDEFLYGGSALVVSVLDVVEPFTFGSDGLYHSWNQDGATLTVTGGNVYSFTDRNGAQYTFTTYATVANCTYTSTNGTPTEPCANLSQVVYPDGETLQFVYQGTPSSSTVSGVIRNDGYALQIRPGASATAFNLATDYCDLTQPSCTFSVTWPQATFSRANVQPQCVIGATDTLTVTDPAGVQTRYTQELFDSLGTGNSACVHRVIGFKAGSSPTLDTTSFSYYSPNVCVPIQGGQSCSQPRPSIVQQVTTGAGVWTYSYTQLSPQAPPQTFAFGRWQTSATRPDGFQTTGVFNIVSGFTESVAASNGSLVYSFPTGPGTGIANYITGATDSEGRNFTFAYDSRDNILTKTQVAGSGGTNTVIQANYDATCANPVKCNKPNWIIDANGNKTVYTYDPVHGGVLTETLPTDTHGVQPQKRYTYARLYAWIKNSAGSYVHAATPIWKRTALSYCMKGNPGTNDVGCALAGDEVLTTYDYGPASGPNNLLLRGEVVKANGVSHRTCYAYDVFGNKISETKPNANLASCP